MGRNARTKSKSIQVNTTQSAPLQEWLGAKDFRWLSGIFQNRQISIYSNLNSKKLKWNQNGLPIMPMTKALIPFLHNLATLALKSRVGLENILWQGRLNSHFLKEHFEKRTRICKDALLENISMKSENKFLFLLLISPAAAAVETPFARIGFSFGVGIPT